MSALEAWLTDSLVPQPPWLQQWSTNLQVYRRDPGCLTIQGHQELHGIGFRFAQLYAQSLQNVGNTVRLRSSYKTRAISSARSFLEGYLHACSTQTLPLPNTVLDNEQASDTSESNPSESESSESEPTESDHSETDLTEISSTTPSNDSETLSAFSVDEDDPVEILPFGRDAILRYFEQNHEYATFAVQHKALTQKDLSRGPLRVHAVEMASRMSAGLGASSSMDVDFVRAVAEACAFDCAHGRAETSMFCRVLTPQDTAVLELFEKHHRPYFKGHERFRTVAAPLIEDLVSSLKSSAYGSDDVQPQAADLRFAHAETLVPLLLLLGIRTNGLNPDHPDFLQGLCAMSPFAANFALELYEQNCATGKRHFVRFRLHERYVECIPALGEHGVSGVVELEHLLAFFEGILAEGLHQ